MPFTKLPGSYELPCDSLFPNSQPNKIMAQTKQLPDGVYQDGVDFYHEDDGHIFSAPVELEDSFDTEGADEAREHFFDWYTQGEYSGRSYNEENSSEELSSQGQKTLKEFEELSREQQQEVINRLSS